MIALGIAFLLEYLNDQLTTEEEVEQYLGLPTLAMITKMKPEDFQNNHSRENYEQRVGGRSDVKLNQ
ncbi:hypothetical protein D3C85_1821570 [compost metagenome]